MTLGHFEGLSAFNSPDESSPVDQTANRFIGTAYQNTTGKMLFVCVVINMTWFNATSFWNIQGLMDFNNPPTTSINQTTDWSSASPPAVKKYTVVIIVPKNAFYKIFDGSSGNSININKWFEMTIG